MDYINWIDGSISHAVPEDSISWDDIITGTGYYLKKEKAKEIEEKALEFINSCGDVDLLSRYMIGEEVSELTNREDHKDLMMFPQLPYITHDNKNQMPYRICDHVSIRTGILSSILGKSQDIRMAGLTKGVNIYSGRKIEVKFQTDDEMEKLSELIDRVLSGQYVSKEECEDYRFDMVKGGTVKVKQYYLETNKIKDIRGASRILDEINREIIPAYVEENFLRENIIYCGGGNILGVFPSGSGHEVCKTIEGIHEEESITAQSAAAYRECTLFDISCGMYQNTMSDLTQRVTGRQMTKFDSVTNPAGGIKDLQDYRVNEEGMICTHCNIREASYTNGDESLCTSCMKKVLKGGRQARGDYRNQFIDYCKKNRIHAEHVDNIDTLNDISKHSANGEFIAVIYGDGNNMGRIVQNVRNMGQIRYFSRKTEEAVFAATYKALGSTLHKDTFEIIAIGGDDIFMMVPASYAMEIGIQLGRNFDEIFKNKSTGEYNVTMSLGISISHSNTPVQYMFDLSQQLLKNAKRKSKSILSSTKGSNGTLDIMVLETESAVGASLKSIRRQMVKDNNSPYHGSDDSSRPGLNLTLRPYTWDEAECIQEFVGSLKKNNFRTRAYGFREAVYNMYPDEAELYYLYDMKKLKNRDSKTFNSVIDHLKSLYLKFNAEKGHGMIMRINGGGKYIYSIWPDVVELWDYCMEKGGELS